GDEATERAATDDEVGRMRAIVGEAIDAGAIGFASSKSPTHSGDGGKPVPSRLADIDEITRLASAMGDKGRGVFQATIGPGFYVKELAALSEAIGRPATWTALLTLSEAPGRAKETLDKQAALGGEVWPQIACRPLVFQITLEDPFPFAMAAGFDEIGELLNDNRAVIGLSDAGAHASQICDACFSTHLLGHWVRELGAVSLEQAVHRLTAHAAHVFRIPDRGTLRAGAFADLVAFDPDTVGV